MSARVRAALLALLALVLLGGPLAAGPPVPTVADSAGAQTATPTQDVPVGTTVINIQLETDGDAVWTIRTRLPADNEQEREAFGDLADRYESGEMEAPWVDEVTAANDAAERATGRQMSVTDVRKASNTDNTTLSLTFTWTNFAREEDEHYVVDDAFNTTSGTWLDGLTANQVLVIELPPGHGVVSAPLGAAVQNAHVRWDGPAQFEPGYMRVVYSGDAGPTLYPNAWPFGTDGLVLGGVFVLGIVAIGAYALSQRRRRNPPVPAGEGDQSATTPSPASPSGRADDVGERAATAGTVEPDVDGDDAGPSDGIDEELLSDEERVERLLDANGGRMKQANIVKETGWSNAKVSQLLSAMEEAGQIDKLRIGRENLISFPDEDVTDVDRD